MSVSINFCRTFTGQSTVDKDVIVTFEFIEPEDQVVKLGDNGLNVTLRSLRQAIVACEGFNLPDGSPMPIKNDKGEILIANQKIVFNWINTFDSDLAERAARASTGLTEKKLKGGSTPPSLGSGDQVTALAVNTQEGSAENTDATEQTSNPS